MVAADGAMFVEGSWGGDLLVRSITTGEVVHHERDEGMITHVVCPPNRSHFGYAASAERRVESLPQTLAAHRACCGDCGDARWRNACAWYRRLRPPRGDRGLRPHIDPVVRHGPDGRFASRAVRRGSGVDVALSPHGAVAIVEDNRAVCLTDELGELWSIELPSQCSAEFSASGAGWRSDRGSKDESIASAAIDEGKAPRRRAAVNQPRRDGVSCPVRAAV